MYKLRRVWRAEENRNNEIYFHLPSLSLVLSAGILHIWSWTHYCWICQWAKISTFPKPSEQGLTKYHKSSFKRNDVNTLQRTPSEWVWASELFNLGKKSWLCHTH